MIGFGTSPVELMASDAMLKGEVYCESFDYTFLYEGTTALGATSSVDAQINIDGSSDFVYQEQNFVGETAVDTFVAIPDILVTIVSDGSGRQIMNRAIPLTCIAGNYQTNQFPSRMPFPRLLQAKATLTCTLNNRGAAVYTSAHYVLRGFKIFYLTKADGSKASRREIFHVL